MRDTVTDIRPADLSDFDFVVAAFARNPRAAKRAMRGRDDPTAAGWDMAAQTTVTLLLPVTIDVCHHLHKRARAGGMRGMVNRLRRGERVGPQTVAPPIAPGQEPAVRAVALRAARRYRASAEVAEIVANSLVRHWNGRP